MRRITVIASCLLGAWCWLGAGGARAARACSMVGPGIQSRSVWPPPEQPVPTNARIVVTYAGGIYDWWPQATIAPFGPDLTLLDGGGQPVAATVEVVDAGKVVVRPAAPLQPGQTYQLADRHVVPCDALQNQCVLAAGTQVFATFTAAEGPDVTPPSFAGLKDVAVTGPLECDSSSCCGTYSTYPVVFSWEAGSDDRAGVDLRYNLYRRDGSSASPELVIPLVSGTEAYGMLLCSGSFPTGRKLRAGAYVARAVDGAGNEETNQVARELRDRCGCACDVAPGSGGGAAAGLAVIAFALSAARARARSRAR